MEHSITGERSWHMDSFDLKATDVQKARRNFPGTEEEKFYTLEDMRKGDHHLDEGRFSAGGMTETDEVTSGQDDGPYTEVQSKGMGQKTRWPNKNSSSGRRYNSEKALGKIKDPLSSGKTRP